MIKSTQIKLFKRKPKGNGLFLVRYFGYSDVEIVYIKDKFIFNYPRMNNATPLDDCCSVEYCSDKLNLCFKDLVDN